MYILKSRDILDSFQRLHRAIKRRSALINPESYGRSQGRVLRLIAANDGINASDLANLLEIKPPSLTVKLKKLEADGNIIRRKDEIDNRFTYIHITQKGYAAINRRDEDKKTVKQDFSDCLSAEEKILFCEMCDRLSANLNRILDEEKQAQVEERIAKNRLVMESNEYY
ncbi:MAG: MarR family transcriptional regulator [Firmicutes bacterium]|nr:MarR family transcriptional regulator [Bacillota bacterium]